MKRKIIAAFSTVFILGFVYLNWFSPIVYKSEPYAVNYTVEEATKAADTVVIGKIKKVGNSIWNGKSGKKPDRESSNMKLIFKPTIVEVDEYLKNPEQTKILNIINPGGTVERETVIIEGIPSFEEGQKVVLFLWKDVDPGDGVKRNEVIWSYSIKDKSATNMRKVEQIPLDDLKQQIINSAK